MSITDGLVAGYDLQEADTALFFRNSERTLVFEEDFTNGSSYYSGYGDVPTGWTGYKYPGASQSPSIADTSDSVIIETPVSPDNNAYHNGIQKYNQGVIDTSKQHVAEVTFRVLDYSGTPAIEIYDGSWYQIPLASYVDGDWHTVAVPLGSASADWLILSLYRNVTGQQATVEISNLRLYEENAAAKYGTLPNQVAGPGGSLPYAQEFNGSSDYATSGGRITSGSLTELSVAAHVRCDATSGVNVIASEFNYSGNQRGWFIGYDASLKALYVYLSADGGTANAKVYLAYSANNAGWDITTWTHVAFTFGDGSLALFVNGRRQTTSNATDGGVPSIFDSSARFEIGHRQTVSTDYWDGAIVDLRIYNRALPSDEIAQLVALGPTRLQEVGLLAHYKLDETSGTTLRATPSETLRSYDFTDGVSGTDAYGDIPTGGLRYTSGLEGDETTSCVVGSDSLTISLAAGATGSDYLGVDYAGVATVGVAYAAKIRYRVLAISGVCDFKASVGYSAAWKTFGSSSDPLGEWVEKTIPLGIAAITSLLVGIYATDAAASMTVEIDSIEFLRENAATLSGDAADNMTTAGVIGRALQFSGAESGVGSFGGGLEYPFPAAGWLVPTGAAAVRYFAAFGDAGTTNVYWGGRLDAANQIQIVRSNTTPVVTDTGVTLTAGTPYFVAIEFVSATHAKLWVDGVLVWEDDALTSVPSSAGTDRMMLGDYITTDSNYQWGGKLDDWRFYARGLSDAEILDLYNNALSQRSERSTNYSLYNILPTSDEYSQRLINKFKSTHIVRDFTPDLTDSVNIQFDFGVDISSITIKTFKVLQNSIEPITGILLFETDGTDGLATAILDANSISGDFIIQATLDDWTSNQYLYRLT